MIKLKKKKIDNLKSFKSQQQEQTLEKKRFPGNYRNTERKESKQKRKVCILIKPSSIQN